MNRSRLLFGIGLCVGLVGCGDDSGFLPVIDGGPATDTSSNDAGTPDSNDAGTPDSASTADAGGSDAATSANAPGSECNCDTECEGTAANPGLCVRGICMTAATGMCSAAGSADECPEHSRCWSFQDSPVCWPDSDFFDCEGETDGDGSCIPTASNSCDESCSEFCGGTDDCPPNSSPSGDGCACDAGFVVNEAGNACVRECTMPSECGAGLTCVDNMCVTPPCTAGSCGDGAMCDLDSGSCIIDIGTPPPGPVPTTCEAGMGTVPDWRCTADCGELVPFEPDMGPGYWDYPLNGETDADQYRSFIRRDVMMLVKYATAMVACQTGGWDFGNGDQPLGLGDMSEADGSIPGTREGSPGHPAGTHVNGHDMDIGYYQTGTPNNVLRPICEHTTGGADQYHCTGPTTLLDPWRTALFLGHLHINSMLRVIGVDGRAGGPILSATAQLCSEGWLETSACSSPKITFEETDGGAGWYRFHHHHLHISVSGS